ncbi:hypothetical protein N7532_001352 [Penicillium argentinense]|uniref:Vacuolar ATPase assembly protein VMA22 n=1 Tax=Penicillium argentinense TaxID=1131581 RepID=A0A9W9G2F6_9EURO|nr:uncharacterized protein N7532_001352 [Penicillium argentinense]KAJ5110817.1 hypothetical protein N7532_001352 [Penicillium argentinense]
MVQVPTPPASRLGSEDSAAAKPVDDQSELLQSLDELLEQYLHLLDRQQKLQSGLAKELSSKGFLALAHANYTCPPGRRYGADYYDERMKATRKMSVRSCYCEMKRTEADVCGINSSIQTEPEIDAAEDTTSSQSSHETEYKFLLERVVKVESQEKTDEKDEKIASFEDSQSEAEATPQNNEGNTNKSDESPSAESKAPKKKFHSNDPLHWYGILVPPSLRNAQRSFTAAVEGQVPELAGVVVEMRALEHKIAELRTEIGVEPLEEASPGKPS